MAELNVYDRHGKTVGKYTIDVAELAPRINKQLLHDAAVMYQANARMGTSKTKARGEVSGSTKKLYRQKGTGNARAGSRQQWHPSWGWSHPRPAPTQIQLSADTQGTAVGDLHGDRLKNTR